MASDVAPAEAPATRSRAVKAWKSAVAAVASDMDVSSMPSIIESRTSITPVATPAPPRLAVMVHGVRGLPATGKSSESSPKLYIKAAVHLAGQAPLLIQPAAAQQRQQLQATAKTAPARMHGSLATWRQLLSLSPTRPRDMMLTLTLKHKMPVINKTIVWGSVSLPLREVMDSPGQWGERQALRLTGSKVDSCDATLELQLFLSAERIQGPLSVLCATWNVGNAAPPPPQQLQDWLWGASQSLHHLVAVGAQECNYTKDTRRSASAARRGGSLPTPLPAELAAAASADPSFHPLPSTACAPVPAELLAASPAAAGGAAAAAASTPGSPFSPSSAWQPPGSSVASVHGSASRVAGSEANADVLAGSEAAPSEPELQLRGGSGGGPQSPYGGSGSRLQSQQSEGDGEDPGPAGLQQQQQQRRGSVSKAAHLKTLLWEQVDSAPAWERHISAALGHKFWLVASKHMYQTRILLFARMDVVPAITNINTAFEATGLGHIGMNKGGVGVSLQLDDTHLAFVSSHLAAHQSKTAGRNADMGEIASNMHLPGAARGADLPTGFHHVVWMGDLNYRLEYGQQAETQADSPTPEDFAALCDDIAAGRYEQLLALDQLKREMGAGRVFAGFREGPISFAPSFKVEKGEPGYHYAPKRSPAWCDRVLLKSALPHKQGSHAAYFTDAGVCSSDHKPVGAVLALPLVTHTVASGRLTGRTPFKLYVSSVKLKGDATWRRLADALAAAQQAQRPRLLLVLSGSCLAGAKGEHRFKVNTETVLAGMSAVGGGNSSGGGGAAPNSSAGGSSGGGDATAAASKASLLLHEENAALLPGAVDDLTDDWLLLRLVLVEGLQHKTLARGVVPLQPAVAEYKARSFKAVAVAVQLESRGAVFGSCSLQLQLISSVAARQGMYEAIRRMRVLATIRSHSMNDSVHGSRRRGGDCGAVSASAHSDAQAGSSSRISDWLHLKMEGLGRGSRRMW